MSGASLQLAIYAASLGDL